MASSSAKVVYETYPAIAPEKYKGQLKGKVTIVTGCSVGIGRAIAKAFAAAGASVAAVARREAELLTLVDEIRATGGTAIPIPTDVGAPGAATALIARVEEQLGPIDILISNAGISRLGALSAEPADLDLWWRVFEVNVRAPVALIRAALPSMLARNTGVLITTSSAVATMPLPVMTAYAASKAAISKFHESLVPELAGTDILSFAVHPGVVPTELGTAPQAINQASMDHPALQKFVEMIKSGNHKGQTPEVCADTMVALAADPAAKVLNGHHINATEELPPVIAEAQKEGKGRIGKERLYLVNIGTL